MLFVTKAATGAENALMLEAYGEAGGVPWQQEAANELRVMRQNLPTEIRSRGLPTLHPLAQRATRLPPGHPEASWRPLPTCMWTSPIWSRRGGRGCLPIRSRCRVRMRRQARRGWPSLMRAWNLPGQAVGLIAGMYDQMLDFNAVWAAFDQLVEA